MTKIHSKRRSFLGDSMIYGLSSILSLATGFLLIPLYTHTLPAADYGLYEIFNLVSNILFIVIYMGTINSFVRFYFDSEDIDWKKTVTGTSIVFNLFSFTAVSLIAFLFRDWFVNDFVEDQRAYFYIDLLIIWMFWEMLYRIGTTFLQINRLPLYYFFAHLVRASIFVASVVYLLWYRDWGIEAILTANILACGIFGAGFLVFALFWTRLRVSGSLMLDLLKYGVPFLPAAIFWFIVGTSDRFFLNRYAGLAEVGIYALAAKIGMISASLLSQAFVKVWAPFVFDNYAREGGAEEIGRIYQNYSKLLIFSTFCIAIAGPIVIPYISAPEYHAASLITPLICLGALLQGMGLSADTGLLIAKQTKFKIHISILASITAVAANLIFTRHWGMIGAAISFCLGMFVFLVTSIHFSNRFYRLLVNWAKLAQLVILAVVIYVLFATLLTTLPTQKLVLLVSLQSLLGLVAVAVLLLSAVTLRLITLSELRDIGRLLMRIPLVRRIKLVSGKKRRLAKMLYGRLSPMAWFLRRHKFRFPAIITYHRIIDVPSDYRMTRSVISATPEEFDQQLAFLKKSFHIINLRDLACILDAGETPQENSLIITFDDGYFDNHRFALPLLLKHNLTATVFVTTGPIDSQQPFWVDKLAYQLFTMRLGKLTLLNGTHVFEVTESNRNDVRVAIGRLCATVSPSDHQSILDDVSNQTGLFDIPEKDFALCRPLTWDEIRDLHSEGIEIGAHSVNHGYLNMFDTDLLSYELTHAKQRIQAEVGEEVISMAYPSGRFGPEVERLALQSGYRFCCIFDDNFEDDPQRVVLSRLSRISSGNHMPLSLFKAHLLSPNIFIRKSANTND